MSDRQEHSVCAADAELERRIAAKRPSPSLLRDLEDRIGRARAAADAGAADGDATLARLRSRFNEARLIHKYVHQTPFRDGRRAARSGQWEAALARYRHLGNIELIDWLRLQVEVARNLETGVQDMRPRKNGPTWLVLLEHVANAKRKALAVLRWAIASETAGRLVIDSGYHARTERILERRSRGYGTHEGGHEAVPWRPQED